MPVSCSASLTSHLPRCPHLGTARGLDVQNVYRSLDEIGHVLDFFRSEGHAVVKGPIAKQTGFMQIADHSRFHTRPSECVDPGVEIASRRPLFLAEFLDRRAQQGCCASKSPAVVANRRLSKQGPNRVRNLGRKFSRRTLGIHESHLARCDLPVAAVLMVSVEEDQFDEGPIAEGAGPCLLKHTLARGQDKVRTQRRPNAASISTRERNVPIAVRTPIGTLTALPSILVPTLEHFDRHGATLRVALSPAGACS